MTNVIVFSNDHDDPNKLMSGSAKNSSAVPLDSLNANVAQLGPAIASLVSELKTTAKDAGLTEVTLALGVNGKGTVGFLGTGAEMGGNATISLKFKID